MRKIEYKIAYSNGCQIEAKFVANNVANIFVDGTFRNQVTQDNLIDNIDGYVNQYAHEVCCVEDTNDWLSEDTTFELEDFVGGDFHGDAIISHNRTAVGGF